MVLLHGWPQTWYEFRPVMSALAKNHTLIVVDLPGLGDSRGKPSSYDKKTLARTLHRLIADRLGHRRIDLVGHDFGAGVAFQYAAQHPAEVKHLVHMDYPLPGPSTPAQGPTSLTWHFGFNAADDHLAERLVRGQERIYMQHIYNLFGGRPNPVPPRAVKEYVRTYSQPAKLSAGFELYRTLPLDQKHNNALVDDKPGTMPVLVLGASIYGDDSVDVLTADIRPFAHNVTGRFVPDSGHWMSEEKPRFVIKAITRFVN